MTRLLLGVACCALPFAGADAALVSARLYGATYEGVANAVTVGAALGALAGIALARASGWLR